jgi:hypothetical protein
MLVRPLASAPAPQTGGAPPSPEGAYVPKHDWRTILTDYGRAADDLSSQVRRGMKATQQYYHQVFRHHLTEKEHAAVILLFSDSLLSRPLVP